MFSKKCRSYFRRVIAILFVPMLWIYYRSSTLDLEFKTYRFQREKIEKLGNNLSAIKQNEQLQNVFQNICYFQRLVGLLLVLVLINLVFIRFLEPGSLLDDLINLDVPFDDNIFFHETTCPQNGIVNLSCRQACSVESAGEFLILNSYDST